MSDHLNLDPKMLDALNHQPELPADKPEVAQPLQRRPVLHRLLTTAMLACFVLGGWFFAQSGTSAASVTADQLGPSLTHAAPELETQSIETLRLGQRVAGRNPLREETQTPSRITPESWRAVRLTMDYHGVRYDLAFLRSLDWLQAAGATPGGNIHLSLPEMGLDGPALVESIDACPPIEPDDGTGRMVVTGTMRHLASNVLDVTITGLDEPLGVTDTHPIWSETRHDFVTAGQLQVGEHLRSETGAISQVTRITPTRGPPQLTYNLEVDAQHVYEVGKSGLLVHNACDGLYHDTDADGLAGIMESGVIGANSKGKVFLTTDAVAQSDTATHLFAGNSKFAGKGDFVVEIRPRSGLALEGGEQANELIHLGSLREGRDFEFIYHGVNLLRGTN